MAQYPAGHTGPVLAARFDQSGRFLLTGGQDRTVRLWQGRRAIHTFGAGHNHAIYDLAISPSNGLFLSAGGDHQAVLWDVASGRLSRRLGGHEQAVRAVEFWSEDLVLTGSEDCRVRISDLRAKRTSVQVLDDAKDSISSIATRGYEAFVASIDGAVRRYDARRELLNVDTFGHSATSVAPSVDADSVYLVSVDNNELLLVDCLNHGQILNTFTGHKHEAQWIRSVFVENEAFVCSASEDGRLLLWDIVGDGRPREAIDAHADVVTCVAVGSESLVSASLDGTLREWALSDLLK